MNESPYQATYVNPGDEMLGACPEKFDLLRSALDHIAKTARASRSQTRRIRWIERRAEDALLGKSYDQDAVDLPKTLVETPEKIHKKLMRQIHRERIAHGITIAMWTIASLESSKKLAPVPPPAVPVVKQPLTTEGDLAAELLEIAESFEINGYSLERIQQAAAAITASREALAQYHQALDSRQHEGLAAGTFVEAMQSILSMPWVQGATQPTMKAEAA